MENEMILQGAFQALTSRHSSENNRKSRRMIVMASMVLIITLLISMVTVSTIYFQAKNYLSDVKQETTELIVALHKNTSTLMSKPDTKDWKTQNYLKEISNAVKRMQDVLQADISSSESVKDLPGFQILKNIELTQVAVRMLKQKEENARGVIRATKTELGLQILRNPTACPILQNQDENATETLAQIQKELKDTVSRLQTGWKINGRNIYYFSTGKKNWTDAEEFCVFHDSHLASITTSEEQSFIKDTMGRGAVWIGLTDEGSEGKWRFVDGSKYGDPLFWTGDNPDNWKDNEHCAAITAHEDWNDADCALVAKWICKMPIL
ncbi:uncharacterized protein LOC144817774 isoform X1 [Lissotriton helveticus]